MVKLYHLDSLLGSGEGWRSFFYFFQQIGDSLPIICPSMHSRGLFPKRIMSHFLAISKFTTSILEGPAVHSHRIDIYLRGSYLSPSVGGTLARTTSGAYGMLDASMKLQYNMASNISPHHREVGLWALGITGHITCHTTQKQLLHRKLESKKKDGLSGSKQWDLVELTSVNAEEGGSRIEVGQPWDSVQIWESFSASPTGTQEQTFQRI